MLGSKLFIVTDQQAPLLLAIVIGTLNGKPPTEEELGIWLLGWEPGFHQHNAGVRIYVGRLRKRLAEYYRTEGRNDLVKIDVVGTTAIFTYNYESPFMPKVPFSLSPAFTASLESHFVNRFMGDLRCVVTGEPADWYHLDGDPCNNALGNLVPLCERLGNNLDGLRDGKKPARLEELSPGHLDNLAAVNHQHWRTAAAYGCAHLAFHLGEAPFGQESSDIRALRFCNTLYYARHTFNDSIVAYVIRHSLLPLVSRIDSLDPRPLCRLALQLSGLLDESGYFDAAATALSLAKGVSSTFGPLAYPPSSIHKFTLLRREAQLHMEKDPKSASFTDLMKRVEEQSEGDPNRSITVELVKATRYFRQGTAVATKRVYEAFEPIVSRYAREVFTDLEFRQPAHVTPVNLAEMFIFLGISACRLRRTGWEDHANDALAKGKRLYEQSGARIMPEFWNTIATETFEANPKSVRILQPLVPHVRSQLRQSSREDIDAVLARLKNIALVENDEIDEADENQKTTA